VVLPKPHEELSFLVEYAAYNHSYKCDYAIGNDIRPRRRIVIDKNSRGKQDHHHNRKDKIKAQAKAISHSTGKRNKRYQKNCKVYK